ncbi:hypothetical protein CCAX7_31610 [Capsulimonas corticalis]|uniref:Uncharacterized protein n=1 Tax=Capsulimonas corticalis TaxID=2219043 RepID=A0A402CSE7_9BACT|nr:hypothetical protein [Capsulimonas corticalis]BDI31110.1 hypothetical protein CCAX7_31610 [Capsulimonas corticalis]
MARIRRVAAPDAASIDETAAGQTAASPDNDTQPAAEGAAEAPAKPIRRRAPRRKAEPAAEAEIPASDTTESLFNASEAQTVADGAAVAPVEAAPAEVTEAPARAPRRRRTPAAKTVAAPVEVTEAAIVVDAEAAESETTAAVAPETDAIAVIEGPEGLAGDEAVIADVIDTTGDEAATEEIYGDAEGEAEVVAGETASEGGASRRNRRNRSRRRGSRQAAAETAEAPAADAAPAPATSQQKTRAENRAAAKAAAKAAAEDLPQPARRKNSRRRSPGELATAPIAEEVTSIAPETVEAAAIVEEPEEEVLLGPDGLPLPVRRRRSRRTKNPLAETPAATEAKAAPADASETESEETDEGGKKSRRRRGGRRRRNGDEAVEITESTELLVGGEPLAEEEAAEPEEEEVQFLALAAAPPTYIPPPLVPPVAALPAGAPLPRVHTAIHRSAPCSPASIVINGAEHAPYFFFVNAETAEDGEVVDAQIRHAATHGVHLYSAVMYLPLRNAYGERSFGRIDSLVQQILAADPHAHIMPRLQFVPTNYWVRTHPDQMAQYADGSEGDVSLASREFWSDCVDAIESLIAHFSDPATKGGDRIIGFHLDRGEWFNDPAAGHDVSEPNVTVFRDWLHAKYQLPYLLRAAWYDGSVTFETAAIPRWDGQTAVTKKTETAFYGTRRETRWVDYCQYSSEIAAQAITGLAAAIKTLSGGQLLVGTSYGYTLEFAHRNDSGHLALTQVLASPDVDIVAGPNSYTGRGAGNAAAFGAPIDSVALHGKLWIVEDDTKTFLAENDTEDSYNPKINGGADTRAAHQRQFGGALAHGAGVTWMDLWGQGWLNNAEIWEELGGLGKLAHQWGKTRKSETPAPDVAAIIDEASLAYLKNDPNGLGMHLIGKTRELLLRSGASVGFYLQSDITKDNFPDATLYLFLNAFRITTAEREAIRTNLQRAGKTLAWLYAPGVYDENGPATLEVGDVVGMSLRQQPWNSRVGSQISEQRHPITERLRSGKRIGQEDVLNPSFAVSDPQATVLAEYGVTGAPSLAVREHQSGWKSVFFGDPHLTVELLRGLFAYAGVPLYDTQDDVVFASDDGVLNVHTQYTGQRTIQLPRRATVWDVMENRICLVDGRSFRAFIRARTTRLFLWGSADEIAAISGLEIIAPQQPPRDPQSTANEEELLGAEAPAPGATPQFKPEPTKPRAQENARPKQENAPRQTPPPSAATRSIPGLDDIEALPEGEGDDEDMTAPTDEDAPAAPRSRWQRRRAAARARREAERAAKPAEGADGTPAAPMDMATVLPGLPPRRVPTPKAPTPEEGDE